MVKCDIYYCPHLYAVIGYKFILNIIENSSRCLNGGEWDSFFEWCACANGYSGLRCEKGIEFYTYTYDLELLMWLNSVSLILRLLKVSLSYSISIATHANNHCTHRSFHSWAYERHDPIHNLDYSKY